MKSNIKNHSNDCTKIEKGCRRFQELKEKVKQEVKQLEMKQINKKQNNRYYSSSFTSKSELLNNGWILSSQEMQFLRNHPYIYCAFAGSYLELLFLQRFWSRLARFTPKFLAPSLITFTGLTINILCSFSCLYYSVDLKSEVTSWAYVICAIGTFFYQTLDALDGKQCMVVQNSQLEELTDHGCDAVSTIFLSLSLSSALQLGSSPTLFYLYFISILSNFFSAHFVGHITHSLNFKKIDVSEGQIALIIIFSLTGYFGHRIWKNTIFFLFSFEFKLAHLLAIVSIVSMISCIYDNFEIALFDKMTSFEACDIKIPRRKGSAIYNPLYPFTILIILSLFSYLSGFLILSPLAFGLTYGFAFSKLSLSLVMSNISKGEFDKWDSSLVAPFLLTINQSMFSVVHPYTALLCASVYSIMDFLRYFTYACWDVKAALDVDIFTIKYFNEPKKRRRVFEGFYINGTNNEQVVKAWKKFEAEEKNGLYKEIFG